MFAAGIAARADATGLQVQPNHLYLTVVEGNVVERKITVAGFGDVARVRVRIDSFSLESDGRPRHGSQTAPPDWLHADRQQFDVLPGQPVPLTLRITLAESARGTSWAVVFLEVRTANVLTRVAVPVFATLAGTETLDAEVISVHAHRSGRRSVTVVASIRNRGNTILHAPIGAAIEVDAKSGDTPVEIAEIEEPGVLILPGGTREIALRLSGDFDPDALLRASVFFRYGQAPGDVTTAKCEVERYPRRAGDTSS